MPGLDLALSMPSGGHTGNAVCFGDDNSWWSQEAEKYEVIMKVLWNYVGGVLGRVAAFKRKT